MAVATLPHYMSFDSVYHQSFIVDCLRLTCWLSQNDPLYACRTSSRLIAPGLRRRPKHGLGEDCIEVFIDWFIKLHANDETHRRILICECRATRVKHGYHRWCWGMSCAAMRYVMKASASKLLLADNAAWRVSTVDVARQRYCGGMY